MARYDTSQRTNESTLQWYRRLAKTADQRLVRLEKLSTQEGFKSAEQWAYASAMQDIEKWNTDAFGKPSKRFNTAAPKTEKELRMKIQDIRNFIEMPTSSVSGIREAYQGRVDTFNEGNDVNGRGGYGTTFTWETLANYYERGLGAKLAKTYGSKTALRAIGKIQKMAENEKKNNPGMTNKDVIKKLREDIKQNADKDINTDLEDEVVSKILNRRNISLKDIL